jgi:ACS family hexuronate transporter-like MFS transporter
MSRPERSSFRWVIVGLLFAANGINYLDRQMIGLLKPTLQHDLGWSERGYGDIVFWFQAAYAVGYISFGRLIDRIGARVGLAVSMLIWTSAHMAHALARSVLGFSLVRAVLGFGEGGAFPGALKAVAQWFPKRERALAVGICNAGTNIGAIVTPLLVPAITVAFGWQAAFVLTGGLSILWLLGWLLIYRLPLLQPRVSQAELNLINSDPPDPPEGIPMSRLLRRREVWAYAGAKFLTDPVWWLFLFWLPDFFAKTHGLTLKNFGVPLAIIYVASDVGAVTGGWVSSRLIARGLSVNLSRKLTMLGCAVLVVPVVFAARVTELWSAVLLLSLATAGHQAFATNLFTLPSDLFPRKAVASVVGIGGAVGAVGGMLMAQYAGWTLQTLRSYTPIFAACALVYVLAVGVVHVMSPRYQIVGSI